jgi:ABC-2 type transport system permease protein
MQVFKVYFKIIRKNIPMLSIYIVVFMLMVVLFASLGNNASSGEYMAVKTRVMIINHDEPSALTDGLVDYLAEKSIIVPPAKDEEGIRDALFFNDAEYVITIPSGFAEDFVSGTHVLSLEKMTAPGSATGVKTDILVQKYLDLFRLYLETGDKAQTDPNALAEISAFVQSDLKNEAGVTWEGAKEVDAIERIASFFAYLAYSLLSIMVLGVSSIMIVFSKRDLKNRMNCAPVRSSRISLEMMLGNLCYAIFAWAAMSSVCLLFAGSAVSDPKVWMLVINALALSIAALSISFLVGSVIRSPSASQAIANVIALGSCFLSGVFVPQWLLGDTVKRIASFTPTFWYVSAIEKIKVLQSYDWQDTKPIYMYMLIQLGFAAAFLVISLVLRQQKSRKSV